jgi:hypothetical protein
MENGKGHNSFIKVRVAFHKGVAPPSLKWHQPLSINKPYTNIKNIKHV